MGILAEMLISNTQWHWCQQKTFFAMCYFQNHFSKSW